MKKILQIVFIILSLFLFMTCENSINADYEEGGRVIEGRKGKKTQRSGQGGFDLKPYIDASNRNVNAYDITVSDFEELCRREYRCASASIKINTKDHTVTLRNTDAVIRGNEYQNLYAKYEYKMLAAGENLLYLCPVNNFSCELMSGSRKLDVDKVSPFSLYVSFYGFGEGRIEVSSFLNGESMIPGGTYWAAD